METENTGSVSTETSASAPETSQVSGNESGHSLLSTGSAPPENGNNPAGQRIGQGVASPTVSTPVAPAWAPSFEFSVKDKKHQFDEWIRPTITTKEQEAKVRELYEKAYGLDEVKADRQTLKQERDDFKSKFTNVEQSLQTLSGYVKKGDFRTFFSALKIPSQAIINYAIQELKYQELPAEQKAAIDQQRQQQSEFEFYQQQTQTLQQQMQEMVVQQHRTELQSTLARPDYASTVQAFDARVGKPGAFEAEIIKRGAYYETVHKTSPPVSQLVAEVISLIGAAGNSSQQGQTPSSIPTPSQAQGQPFQQQKPVIPSFQGSSAKSPTKKTISSIDDIRKARVALQQT